MNHRFQRNNNIREKHCITSWELVIILDNEEILYTQTIFRSSHIVFYNYNLQNYYIYVKSNKPEIIKYLEINNIGTVSGPIGDNWKIITLDEHILLELL
jgi:hypothetical protein